MIKKIEKINNELKGLSEMYEVKKNASDYWFNKFNSTKIELNRLIIEKKELVNSIENLKMKYDTSFKASNFKDYRIDILKSYISNLEKEVKDLKYLNNFFSIVIKENFNSEDTIIKRYLDEKLNLLIDQNAPECLKKLIQNLIDELNNN